MTPEQIQEEFQRALQLIIDVYEDFNLNELPFPPLLFVDPQDTPQVTLITMKCGKMLNAC